MLQDGLVGAIHHEAHLYRPRQNARHQAPEPLLQAAVHRRRYGQKEKNKMMIIMMMMMMMMTTTIKQKDELQVYCERSEKGAAPAVHRVPCWKDRAQWASDVCWNGK